MPSASKGDPTSHIDTGLVVHNLHYGTQYQAPLQDEEEEGEDEGVPLGLAKSILKPFNCMGLSVIWQLIILPCLQNIISKIVS